MNELYNQLELHYYFSDTSHGFDAITRNECERELLNLFNDASNDLEIKILVEAKPPQNGGFIEVWEFIGTNKENGGYFNLSSHSFNVSATCTE